MCICSCSSYLSIYLSTLMFCSLLSTCTIPCTPPRKTTPQHPKVLWTRHFFTFLTSKCASRHNGMHFFDTSIPKSAPKLQCFVHFDFEMCFQPPRRALFHLSCGQMRFSEPAFWPSGATDHWKNAMTCDFSTFSRACIFFLLPTSAFPSFYIVGSLTSKLPSTTYLWWFGGWFILTHNIVFIQ